MGSTHAEPSDETTRLIQQSCLAQGMKRIEAKQRRETEAAGGGVTGQAACGAQSSEAEIGPLASAGLASTGRARWGIKAP